MHDLVRKLPNTIHSQTLPQLKVRRGKDWTVGKEAHQYHFCYPYSCYFKLRIKTWIKKYSFIVSITTKLPDINPTPTDLTTHPPVIDWPSRAVEKRRRRKKTFQREEKAKKSIHLCDRHIYSEYLSLEVFDHWKHTQ